MLNDQEAQGRTAGAEMMNRVADKVRGRFPKIGHVIHDDSMGNTVLRVGLSVSTSAVISPVIASDGVSVEDHFANAIANGLRQELLELAGLGSVFREWVELRRALQRALDFQGWLSVEPLLTAFTGTLERGADTRAE